MTTPSFHPTHVVPRDGMPAWEAPDPARPTVPLDALLPVRLVDRRGDWGHIVCANGWSAWVDGRLLIAVPQEPPAAAHPLARTADPRPLLTRAEQALGRYRQAVEDLTEGRLDGESFRARTQGLRVGVVVDGESVWLYEAEHERWVYCDGTHLTTYATPEPPAADGREPPTPEPPERPAPGAPEPTRVVDAHGVPWAGPPQGVGDAGAVSERDSSRVAADAGGAAAAEPTRIVGAPELTRGARDAGARSEPEPTRRVQNAGASGAEPARIVGEREPTPVVEDREPTRVVRGAGAAAEPERTRVVEDTGAAAEAEPTRVVEDTGAAAEAEPTRVVDDNIDGAAGPEPTRVVEALEPTQVARDREETRIVGEREAPREVEDPSDPESTQAVGETRHAPTRIVKTSDGDP
ncbi:hypothetical protein [Streptomyces vastus]|uniref:DUF2382 domain-containing protein n=1 Tax=Streptomyces vastus TaxID=285451 RepID=A0ABN3RD07_9ACTN